MGLGTCLDPKDDEQVLSASQVLPDNGKGDRAALVRRWMAGVAPISTEDLVIQYPLHSSPHQASIGELRISQLLPLRGHMTA